MSQPFLFRSSRAEAAPCTFGQAVLQGLAPDGGLYVPEAWPRLSALEFRGTSDLAAVATRLLTPFLTQDPLAPQLPAIAREALDFPAPLVPLDADGRLSVLELFHGPTAAFKDFGARFLAAWSAQILLLVSVGAIAAFALRHPRARLLFWQSLLLLVLLLPVLEPWKPAPVEAPEGTAALPTEPSSSTTSTSTVGLPRLSRISRPMMSTIAVMIASSEI